MHIIPQEEDVIISLLSALLFPFFVGFLAFLLNMLLTGKLKESYNDAKGLVIFLSCILLAVFLVILIQRI
jgi:low affinity Fe/Cu permease